MGDKSAGVAQDENDEGRGSIGGGWVYNRRGQEAPKEILVERTSMGPKLFAAMLLLSARLVFGRAIYSARQLPHQSYQLTASSITPATHPARTPSLPVLSQLSLAAI